MLTESEPHYRQPLLRTPFHERARALSQLDSFVPWAGYTTVDVFTSVEQEYFAIRNASSLYDLTPMVKYRISGPDALRFLNRLVTRDMGKVAPGKVAYTVWCDDEGHLIDDGTVFCIARNEYRICTAERQLDWFRASAIGFDVDLREVTEEVAALAVQGPTSCKLLRAVGLGGVERLKPFEHAEFSMPGSGSDGQISMMVSRTGFTGDLGYELWMPPADAEAVWDALMAVGNSRAVRPIGSKALNMARIEAGFVLPNLDFVSAAHTLYPGSERSPLEAGLGVAGGFQERPLHRPPGALGRAGTRGTTPAGGPGYRGHQARPQRAAVHRALGEERGGQCDLGDLVAHLQAQSGTRHGGCALLCDWFDRMGRDIPQSRARVAAAHGACAGGRTDPSSPPRGGGPRRRRISDA